MSIIIKIINFIESKIEFSKFCSYGTTILNILDNTIKYIIVEIFFSGGATMYNVPSDQTGVDDCTLKTHFFSHASLSFLFSIP